MARWTFEPVEGAIVRIEVLGGEYLYAIRIVRDTQAGFNLCPADICEVPDKLDAPSADLGACPVSATPGLMVTRFDPPAEAIETVIRLARAASIDVGGVEYLVAKADGRIFYYDVNSPSNFVANAETVVGFDPTARFADFIVRRVRPTHGRPRPRQERLPLAFSHAHASRDRAAGGWSQLLTGGGPWSPAAQ